MSAPKGELDELKLIDVPQLEELIEATPAEETQKEYLRKRWLHQIRWWDKRAWEAQGRYFRLRWIIVLGAVIVPFLTIASFDKRFEPWMRSLAAVVSLVVAASAGLEAFHGWGAIWLEKRRAAELLKAEGWLFLHSSGGYKGRTVEEAFPDFVTEVESQIVAEVGEYVAVTQRGQEEPRNTEQLDSPKTGKPSN